MSTERDDFNKWFDDACDDVRSERIKACMETAWSAALDPKQNSSLPNPGEHHHWMVSVKILRVDISGKDVGNVLCRQSHARRLGDVGFAFESAIGEIRQRINVVIEKESQSDLAKRYEAIDNPVPTIEGVPRMYVGKTAQAGYWYISEDKNNIAKEWIHTKEGLLMWGDIFVPGTHCKPDDSWREMKSIETCSEVDW